MNELIQRNDNRAAIRWKLLTGASALALIAYASAADVARAEDADRPIVWIDLGGQMEQNNNWEQPFAPPFVAGISALGFTSPVSLEHAPRYAFGEYAEISLSPSGTDWTFSASLRYGRGSLGRHTHQEGDTFKNLAHYTTKPDKYQTANAIDFSDTRASNSETHTIVDFQAGKDVGVGLFGPGSTSLFSLGVRFAQFTSRERSEIKSDQDVGADMFITRTSPHIVSHLAEHSHYKSFAAEFEAARSFQGVGPSISWDASKNIAGSDDRGALSVDWGVNGAMLFGRQKTTAQHQSSSAYRQRQFTQFHNYRADVIDSASSVSPRQTRTRSVAVPNIGGFAGMSLRYPNAKISLGYRADFFFDAIDGGIDAVRDNNRAFYGPYASISIGLGSSDN